MANIKRAFIELFGPHSINEISRRWKDSTSMIIVYSQATSNVQVTNLKTLFSNLVYVVHHKDSSIPEYINLHAGKEKGSGLTNMQLYAI